MANRPVRVGGSFAPPLPDAKLTEYEALANNAPGQIKDEMLKLVKMLRVFRETPDSKKPGKPHATGIAMVVPLEEEEVKRIWDYVPWGDESDDHINECDQIGKLFDKIDPVANKDLRNAAFHLLWFARELAQDREPITNDRLG